MYYHRFTENFFYYWNEQKTLHVLSNLTENSLVQMVPMYVICLPWTRALLLLEIRFSNNGRSLLAKFFCNSLVRYIAWTNRTKIYRTIISDPITSQLFLVEDGWQPIRPRGFGGMHTCDHVPNLFHWRGLVKMILLEGSHSWWQKKSQNSILVRKR